MHDREMERVPTAGGAMGTQDDRRVRLKPA